jgi:glycosyltransferase involved in cell wall biosynthesis
MSRAGLVEPRSGRRRLVVTTSFPRHPGDAAGNFVAARVQALIDGGERVHVVAAGDPSASRLAAGALPVQRIPFAVPGAPPLFYAGGAPERLERAPLTAALQAVRLWGGLLPAIRARLAEVDLVESHWLLPSGLAVAACVTPAHPAHVAHAHSGDVALLERLPAGGALARWLLARTTSLVLASDDLHARLRRLAGPGCDPGCWSVRPAQSPLLAGAWNPLRVPRTVVWQRPDAAERGRLRAARGLDRPVVLAVGRLVAIKGHDVLVRAVARLPAAARPILVILGEGDQRAPLTALAGTRGVDLRLPGEVPPADVQAWLSLAELFVHPSRALAGRTEGQPVAVREALAAGVPVLASASGGIPEVAGPALLVPPDDPGALASALMRYLSGTLTSPTSPPPGAIPHVSSA